MRHYTVTVLDAPDADPGHQNQIITQDTNAVHGSTPTEPARPDNKTNYVFDHWAKPDGSTYNFDEPLSGDLTVHAVYRQKRYTVRYDSGTPHSVGSMTDSHFRRRRYEPRFRRISTRDLAIPSAAGAARRAERRPTIRTGSRSRISQLRTV